MLAELLARRSVGARLAAGAMADTRLARLDGEGEPMETSRIPDQARLRELGREVSMDFGALVYAKALGADPKSQAVQAAFDRFLREGRTAHQRRCNDPGPFPIPRLRPVVVLQEPCRDGLRLRVPAGHPG